MAVLAAEQGGPRPAPGHAAAAPPVAPPVAAELTAPLGRVVERENVDPTAETTRMEPVTAPAAERRRRRRHRVEPIPLHGGERRSGRRARHSVGAARHGDSAPAGLPPAGSCSSVRPRRRAARGRQRRGPRQPATRCRATSLYPVKRVAESAGLALTFDDASRAHRHLEIATTRLDEVEQLARNTQAAPTPEVFTSAMHDFDTATDEGARLLLASAESDQASTATDDLRTWATEQSERLTELEPGAARRRPTRTTLEGAARAAARPDRRGSSAGQACDRGPSAPPDGSARPRASPTRTPPRTPPPRRARATRRLRPSRTSRHARPPRPAIRENPPGCCPTSSRTRTGEGQEAPTTPRRGRGQRVARRSRSPATAGDVSVPLPLLPEVTLPPLLPGVPGITIG